ncbi:MAG: hypothetical protein AABN95_05535 [Acidobacteriota bacterium]
MRTKLGMLAVFVLACGALVSMQTIASAQGRSGGSKGGPPAGGSSSGPPAGVGVDIGINRSSDRSNGRADTGRETASERSNGRSDKGLDRARLQRENSQNADRELNDHPGMAAGLHTTANDLRAGYQAALIANPSLKFGQYVAATRIAANLRGRNPNITQESILGGLADGKSIGQTLQDLGLSNREAKEAKKRTEQEIKAARKS